MHFVGLSGMPRRIPDYPAAFASWNLLSSIGSLVTMGSVILFFYMVVVAMNESTPLARTRYSEGVILQTYEVLSAKPDELHVSAYQLMEMVA